MANNGKGLAAIALIIGILGLAAGGYAAYDTFFGPAQEQEPIPEINTYNFYDNWFTPTSASLENVTGEGITLNVTQNSSMYVSFNCYVYHAGASLTEVRIYINDVPVSGFIRITTTTALASRTPMMLQYYENIVEPGTYIVTVKGTANAGTSTDYYTISMYIQTITLV